MSVNVCECGAEVRDAYFCGDCRDRLAADLASLRPSRSSRPATADGTIPWPADRCPFPRPTALEPGLWHTLASVIIRERGIDYRELASAPPGATRSTTIRDADDPEAGTVTVETGIDLPTQAVKAADQIRRVVLDLARLCRAFRIPSTAPAGWTPSPARRDGSRPAERLVVDAAAWLGWRVDGMARHPAFAEAPDQLGEAIAAAVRVVDSRRTRLTFGPCLFGECSGSLLGSPGDRWAICSTCSAGVQVADIRDRLIAEALDSRVTAADAARLVTYLDLGVSRERVANRVRVWAHRGLIAPDDSGLYRFGDIYDRLTGPLIPSSSSAPPSTPGRGSA